MKRIVLSLLLVIFTIHTYAAKRDTICTIKDGYIRVKIPELIDPHSWDLERAKTINIATEYTTVGNTTFTINMLDDIEMCEHKEFGYEAFDIWNNNKKVFEFQGIGRLVSYNDVNALQGYDLRRHAANDYFLEVPLANRAKALLFLGYPYGCCPQYLIIVVLTEKEAKVVYAQESFVTFFYQDQMYLSMRLQSNFQETVDGVTYTPAITHTIDTEYGVLMFKDNQ